MFRLGGAVHEVPLSEGALFALDDQQRLPGEHEEVLLVCLPVVHRHWLARRKGDEVDANLRKLGLPLEGAECTSASSGTPTRVAGVEDEPAVTLRDEARVGLLQR